MSDTDPEPTVDRRHKAFSPARIRAIASNTFTQLVRMKVFYFMLIYTAVVIGVSMLVLRFTFEQELNVLKSVSFGAMSLFASVFAIGGTAILIPKDVEDRTLYTILTKPVPRFEYLLGKLIGILALIAVSLGLMTILFLAVLWMRQHGILRDEIAIRPGPPTEAEIAALREAVFAQGVQPRLLIGVLAIFLQATVLAGIALVVSTFASSTLFTINISLAVYIIGLAQAMATEFYFEEGMVHGTAARMLAGIVAVVFPNFQVFNIVDGIVQGQALAPEMLLRMLVLGGFYISVYVGASWFIFAKKEL